MGLMIRPAEPAEIGMVVEYLIDKMGYPEEIGGGMSDIIEDRVDNDGVLVADGEGEYRGVVVFRYVHNAERAALDPYYFSPGGPIVFVDEFAGDMDDFLHDVLEYAAENLDEFDEVAYECKKSCSEKIRYRKIADLMRGY